MGRDVCLTLKPLLLVVARLPWPSWRARSVTLRPSLPTHRHALGSLLRLISVLNESARSSSSLLVRTRRTRIACPTLLLSSSLRSRLTSSRLKRLRRSLLSTWPSSGRPSRSWRSPRRGPSLLLPSKHKTFERTVKIRRKSVLGQFKHFLNFDPRVKIQKSPSDLSRVSIASSSLDPTVLLIWISSLVTYVHLLSSLDFYIFTDNKLRTFHIVLKSR